MKTTVLVISALSALTGTYAAVNEPCYSTGGRAGVCVSTSACSSAGGATINGTCPADPADIKCCSKPSCGSSSAGNCRWASDCAGSTASNLCPGPSDFKCCSSAAQGWGGYGNPGFPSTSSGCTATAISGAREIVAAWPGRVREIGCIRDCACGSGSDHCCGKATDMMCSDAGGTATLSGREIAEWVMNNRATLNLKYVIWGQKIWETSQDSVKSWASWRTMDDRGDVTANHWDHVHVSYN
ncbi:hypothetical protein RB601_004668 [Gaeumannomyces tritici]